MQSLSLYPAFTNPFPTAPHDRQVLDPSRPRTELPFLDDLQRLVHSNLDYAAQPSPGHSASPFRYERSSFDSSASADSGGAMYDAFGANPSTAYATSTAAYPSLDPASSPPSRQHSDNGDAPSNRFASQSPVSSPVGPPSEPPPRLNLTFPQPMSAPSTQEHFSNPRHQPSLHSPTDRFPPLSSMLSADRGYSRMERFAFPPPSERRMSEPTSHFSSANHFQTPSAAYAATSAAAYPVHRAGSSAGSYADLYAGSEWAPKRENDERDRGEKLLDGPLGMPRFSPRDDAYSPIHSTFSGASSNSSLPPGTPPTRAVFGYGPYADPAGGYPGSGAPGPGGYALYDTGDEESASRPSTSGSMSYSYSPTAYPSVVDQANKTYSFVSLPGNTVRKRPRRRYDEIERLYSCSHPGCNKAYGTLNHLNAHVNMQKHGPKRHPNGEHQFPFRALFDSLPSGKIQ